MLFCYYARAQHRSIPLQVLPHAGIFKAPLGMSGSNRAFCWSLGRQSPGARILSLRQPGPSHQPESPSMPTNIAKARSSAACRQQHRCYYCNVPMWNPCDASFLKEHRLSSAQAKLLQCTAEHIQARCDGGSHSGCNIVAACLHCNRTRHRARKPLDAELYRQHVQAKVKKGRWQTHRLLS